MNKTILVLVAAFTLNAQTITTYKNGHTYEIKERNIIELFRNHVANNKDAIKKRFTAERNRMIKKIDNYKPDTLTLDIPTSKKGKVFYPDIEYTTKRDIKDSKGKLLYKKGFKFNPLNYISMNDRYLFIDYSDKKQRAWVKNQKFNEDITTRIIITNGKIFDAIKDFKREVFYASDVLIKKFEIEAVPSIVEQEQDRVKVTQFKAKD
ncbi:MAG: hypothetical protein CL624_13290 [Arcobacter sp.]|nr:hypothetical protein [Arcobacter sp.]|tara:strand:- start:3550 stop:4170 length:621 start_codon:yes stop_codon:yes gene_type:complete